MMNGPKTTRSVSADATGVSTHPIAKAEHYNKHGIECKEFSRHFHGPKAQAFQYIWRSPDKGTFRDDLAKAVFWLEDWRSSGLYPFTDYESGPSPEPIHGYAGRGLDNGHQPARLPSIEQLRGVAGNYSYNLGRALESVYNDNPATAIELVRAELRRYESEQQSAVAVPTTVRGKR